MNVQILLGYLQPVHLGDQSSDGLDHHRSSPQTPFVSMCTSTETSKDACPLAMTH